MLITRVKANGQMLAAAFAEPEPAKKNALWLKNRAGPLHDLGHDRVPGLVQRRDGRRALCAARRANEPSSMLRPTGPLRWAWRCCWTLRPAWRCWWTVRQAWV